MGNAVGSSLTNPMTAVGDLIDGGTAGAVQRLAIGSANQVLTVTSGAPAWANSAAGFANPMTTAGDLIDGGAAGAAQRLAVGSAGQALLVSSGAPAWGTLGTAGGGTGSATRNFAGLLTPTAVKTTTYAAAAGDFVPCDTTAGSFTVTLPAAPADLTVFGAKQVIQGGTNTVTIACGGADVFNVAGGTATRTLTLASQAILIQYQASAALWYVVADDLPLAQLDSRFLAQSSLPLAIGSGGSGQVTAAAAYNALSPMTTLGDLEYESGAATASRLAGNTTSTKNFLSQTGTGTVSAAPAWGPIAAADLPTGTTSAKGALQLDGTAGDIQPTGTAAAAGAIGKPSDAAHVHKQGCFGGVFGDGSDGAVTLDGSTTFNSFSSLSGSTYTLTRDVFATTLTVNNTIILNTNQFRVCCLGALTTVGSGSIQAPGNNGTAGGTGGASLGNNSFNNGVNGGAGNTGAGSAGGGTSTLGAIAGGAGGAGTGGAGGAAGANTGNSATWLLRNPAVFGTGVARQASGTQNVGGGTGGGGGGGDTTNKGGGGGSGGGTVAIAAWSITNAGTISANGGNGGTPATGNCGGGGGGGGGTVVTYSLTAPTGAGTMTASAGTHGTGVGTGSNGSDGTAGTVLNVVLS